MFERVLNAPLQLYQFCALLLKNVMIKHIIADLFKIYQGKKTYMKHIPDFDSLQFSQKTQFQNTLTYLKAL